MCNCNETLLKHLEKRKTYLTEQINDRRLTDSGKDVTQYLEGRCSQVTEVIYTIEWLQKGKNVEDL